MVSTISRWLAIGTAVWVGLWALTLGVVLYRVHSDAVRAELRDDWAAIRQRDGWAWLRVGVETVLSLGLFLRTCFHTIVYLMSGLGGRPDVSLGLTWTPIRDRPLWNDAAARVFTAVVVLWVAQRITLGWGWPPLVEQSLRVAYTCNAALLVGDPVVGVGYYLRETNMIQQLRIRIRGAQSNG